MSYTSLRPVTLVVVVVHIVHISCGAVCVLIIVVVVSS